LDFTHASLTEIAVKWLRRSHSQKGPGCHIAISEARSGWSGEIPDAIGWRSAGHNDGSVVVEVKVSRSDFLADKKKNHRNGSEAGLGNWRYYMCPEGLISADETPEGWGLLWVNSRGHVKPQLGAVTIQNYLKREEMIQAMRLESDHNRECFILVKLLNRVGNPEELNKKVRALYNEQNRLSQLVNKLKEENKNYAETNWVLNTMIDLVSDKYPNIAEELNSTFMTRHRKLVKAKRSTGNKYIQVDKDNS